MSIIKRLRDIIASNYYAKLEQSKDPEKEVNLFIREMERDLREIKAETDAATANMERIRRNLYEIQSEMDKMDRFARKSLESGDELRARRFLEEKVILKPKKVKLEKQYELTSIQLDQLRLAQDKLAQDVAELSDERDRLVNRLAIAKSKQKTNQVGKSQSNVCLTAFDELEEKANRALAEAEALEELRKGVDSDIDTLLPQYDKSVEVEKEIDSLRKKE
ncbi:PspA/IM30 family protein [Ornithinibacillus halotolerans]|uniref:Phage shock protein A (PspA) family protein n=1 Tax=Ornithinibacillus halotolerans TaxID=1274357 RepID=A0A916W8I8_9BACI|nr:PspA/IM30 family protein [Ornithinibacillus halotolerans]GGA76032.1 hypothetical protein GCM10008025_19610 [Ornithinibacillus halotolerans]